MQNNTDPRQILAQELERWWKFGKHGFPRRHDLARRVGCSDSMLSCYFAGKTFPTLPICQKLYTVSNIPSLEPHKTIEATDWLQSEAARKRHTPEVAAKISAGLRKNWADKPRPVAYLHSPEVVAKRNELLKTPEVKRRHSEGIKASWNPERRKQASQGLTKVWVERKADKAELARLREAAVMGAMKKPVASLLVRKGYSLRDWATESGVDLHTIRDYLAGRRTPHPRTRLKLAKALGIEVDRLP